MWPNPTVGCVLVRDGKIVGRGLTQPGGRPHAEIEALQMAREEGKGATAYLTLEPCCHHGITPPCTEALITAGITRVVVATRDPDPRVSGKGVSNLLAAGVSVDEGLLESEALEINAGFCKRVSNGLPLVTLKAAASLDGRIATASGSSRWITAGLARADSHLLRAQHDAVMISSATAIADNPQLTCRLPGMESRSPVRVLLDSQRRTPSNLGLFRSANSVPLWVFTSIPVENKMNQEALRIGAKICVVDADRSGLGVDLKQTLKQLAKLGITRLLVEAGGKLAAALMRDRLVDRVVIYRAASVIGGDGLPLVEALGIESVSEALQLKLINCRPVGEDIIETYEVGD